MVGSSYTFMEKNLDYPFKEQSRCFSQQVHNEVKSPAFVGEMAKWAGLLMSHVSFMAASLPPKVDEPTRAACSSLRPPLSQPAPVRLLPSSQLLAMATPPQQELSGVGRGWSSSQGSPAPNPIFAQQQQRGGRLRGRLTLPTVRKAVPTPSSFRTPPRPVIPRITSSSTPPPWETPPPPLTSSEASGSIKGGAAELKERSRQTNRHSDVEEAARNNQLSRLSSATLLSWLRGRGELISAKHRKEELMLKVIHCLAEV